jgi:putative membrane protein
MAPRTLDYLPRPIRRLMRRNEGSAWKGLVAGAAGGLVGTIAVTQFQKAWQKTSEKSRFGDLREEESSARAKKSEQKGDATIKAAGKLARADGRELTREEQKQASPWIHYGFGTAMGALYGMAMETSPRGVRAQRIPVFGGLFGSTLFLGAGEMAVPAMGLAEAAKSPSSHLYAWASHMVYGLTTEFVRRQVRRQI